jgi:hypothetical protein
MEKQLTPIQELIKEFENIKETKCKTLQEVVFFWEGKKNVYFVYFYTASSKNKQK